ncbi:hypothetical protein [Enterococcus dongliensis]|uniref:hypothetical protein n=1 Tax=Enterococcus dongliensis TaxID=2559925 RepID=UPI00288F71E8|nr:hypothetical protein [Enterococcus dongliensis]MDT2703933.1 hypothetical protein [Enterococcus dongliensis]
MTNVEQATKTDLETVKREISENVDNQLDSINVKKAWSWSADGADRFTKVYPNENLLLGTLPNNWPTLEGKRMVGAIATLGDEKVLVTASSDTPYYFVGVFNAKQALSDEFIARIKGKRLVASVDVAFVNQLTVPTNDLGISIYYWREGSGSIFSPSSRKTIAGNERIWIDALIPEDAVNVLVAIKGFGSFVSGASFEFENLKLEIVDEVPEITPTIYTPAPSEDPINAYPSYKGISIADSDNPADYSWQPEDNTIAKKVTLDSHTENVGNPHKVTKAQVGLGNVDNYSTATQAEAESGESDEKLMTPLTTKQSIEKRSVLLQGDQDIEGKKNFLVMPTVDGKEFLTTDDLPITAALWLGASFLSAAHTLSLSKNIADCASGIALKFNPYNTSSGSSYTSQTSWCIIPKHHVLGTASGQSTFCPIYRQDGTFVGAKVITVSPTKIIGADANAVGVLYEYVLTGVYEI